MDGCKLIFPFHRALLKKFHDDILKYFDFRNSTITRTLGTTTVTETEYGTTTVNLPSMNAYGQQISLVTSPVVTESMTTSTELRIYRIIFRAQTTYTTVTSTHVFPTEVTSYVTSTMTIQPTAFPGFGFGFPGFAG